MNPHASAHHVSVWVTGFVCAWGLVTVAAAEEGPPAVALPDVGRQIAVARAAAEAEGASLEDRIRFATWALMAAEIAIEPHGLVSTASDLFEEGQAAIDGLREELAAPRTTVLARTARSATLPRSDQSCCRLLVRCRPVRLRGLE